MFTGLIEETGKILSIETNSNSLMLTIEANKVLENLKIGDSVAINGACQTVIKLSAKTFSVFVSSETLAITTFKNFQIGSVVNLERTLRLCDRIDGHLVSGHVDGIAELTNKNNIGQTIEISFKLPSKFTSQIVKKGSITIDGISLTIADINDNTIKVAIIPHTIENTNLKYLKIGDIVNFETDLLAKYVEKYLSSGNNCSNIDMNFLERNGFL